MHLYPINGAAGRIGQDETAWNYRDATWARDYWQALHPLSAGGSYINFMMEEGEDRIKATYGDHYERLASIKAKYDPDNFFRVNQNITPAGALLS